MLVNLKKKKGTYTDSNGEEKNFTRFYLECGDSLIPIEPTYFNKKDEEGNALPDLGFSARKAVLASFAEELPDKTED